MSTRIWIRTTQKGEGRMLIIFPAIGLSLAQAQPNFTLLWNPRDRISCCGGLCSFERNTLSFFLPSSFVIHHVHVGRRHSTPTPSKFLTPMQRAIPLHPPACARYCYDYDEREIIAGEIGARGGERLRDRRALPLHFPSVSQLPSGPTKR